MADRGFTIKDMLNKLGIHLNLPPFMECRKLKRYKKANPLHIYGFMLKETSVE